MSALAPGTVIGTHYRVRGLLGEGGFGAVYEGDDLKAQRRCAIKVLLQADAATEQQFQLEAEMLRQVRTPHMPRVYDFIPSVSGAGPALVMEHIGGESLEGRLRRLGPLDERAVLAVAQHILTALIHLHKLRPPIIHRDIKPANIKVDDLGNAWLLDLGIGKRIGTATSPGAMAATEAYAPIEQLQGQPTDERSDLFALGATLYHLATGQVPISALARRAGVPYVPAAQVRPGLSPDCAAVIDQALGLDPTSRFESAEAMYRAVEFTLEPDAPQRVSEAARFRDAISKGRMQALKSTHELMPRPAVYRIPEPALPAALMSAVAAKVVQRSGPFQLYSHQAESLERARKGLDVVVVTGTASGKTMCFNLPVLECCITDPHAAALYLFPIKALINDQAATLDDLTGRIRSHGGPAISVGRLHGDLNQQERQQIQGNPPRIALSNPDFVHWMLARHTNWRTFFTRLQFIVLDEVHVYRGVFGSNVAMLLRRLLRVCDAYRATPQFICCSATVANPDEFVARLTGRPSQHLVDRDGAARSRRYVHFWEPALADAGMSQAHGTGGQSRAPSSRPTEQSDRRPVSQDAMELTVKAVRAGKQVITFARARQEAERMLALTQDAVATNPGERKQFAAYRGGYTRELREQVEAGLRGGQIRGVYTTNALEMGIDIGGMQASVLSGFPGSRMSFWQQAGRAGRQREDAHVVLIAAANPLDTYFLNNPADLLYGPAEDAILDLDNPYINEAHLCCMARERPISPAEVQAFAPETYRSFASLVQKGLLAEQSDHRGGRKFVYTRSNLPHSRVSMRGVGNNSYEIICPGLSETLGSISPPQLNREAHPKALYFYQGEDYRVDKIDDARKQVVVHPEPRHTNPKTGKPEGRRFTRAKLDIHWAPLQELTSRAISTAKTVGHCHYGIVTVQETVTESKEYYLGNFQEVPNGLGRQEFNPPLTSDPLLTRGFWLDLDPDVQQHIFSLPIDLSYEGTNCDPLQAALHGVEHLLVSLIPTVALCDRRDLGSLFEAHFGGVQSFAHILVYDLVPGGIGLAERAYRSVPQLLLQAYDIIRGCGCAEGCPGCVHSGWCHLNNHCLSKEATQELLRLLVGA